jgi:hypothetical protein
MHIKYGKGDEFANFGERTGKRFLEAYLIFARIGARSTTW